MTVAIVGSRHYDNAKRVSDYVKALAPETVVVSGGAAGADDMAALFARICGLRVVVFLADWRKHGRAAGPIRNRQIVAAADRVVAFWDGVSPGTRNTIEQARAAGKPVEIIS